MLKQPLHQTIETKSNNPYDDDMGTYHEAPTGNAIPITSATGSTGTTRTLRNNNLNINNRTPAMAYKYNDYGTKYNHLGISFPSILRKLPSGIIPALVVVSTFAAAAFLAIAIKAPTVPIINVAMIGNSMMYYNDLPRLLDEISEGRLHQDSCLHGNANFRTILTWGNGMYNIWNNGDSRIYNYHHGRIHDYGACTVEQLLFGYDDNLDQRLKELIRNYDDVVVSDSDNNDVTYNGTANDDDATAVAVVADDDDTDDRLFQQSSEIEKVYGDDFFSYYDGSNPCLRNPFYYYYLQNKYQYQRTVQNWDYIILNDNTRTPARNASRLESLQILNTTYIPWIIETGAVPVLIATYAYWTPYRDMGGLGSIPEFTSFTYEGYQQYEALLKQFLPSYQKPRIAPVGLAFLLIWEENYDLWQRLFHVDQIHCGPMGTYLQSLIVYYTLFSVMPKYNVVVRPDMSLLFANTRRFQPGDHRRDPFPTQEEAAYLYNIVKRIMVHKHIPKTFVNYKNGESVDYDPQDDLFRSDDLF